jgi:hypothetical protein
VEATPTELKPAVTVPSTDVYASAIVQDKGDGDCDGDDDEDQLNVSQIEDTNDTGVEDDYNDGKFFVDTHCCPL